MGWPEIGVILVVGLLVFGPERLPDMARQAAQWVRTIRRMADDAKNSLSSEFENDFGDLRSLRDLDPREAVRREFLQQNEKTHSAWMPDATAQSRPLEPGERAPFDPEAT